MPTQRLARVGVDDGATAEGEDPIVLGECHDDGLPLEGPEMRLTMVDEQLRDRRAGGLLDIGVGVSQRHAEPLGEQPTDRRLAGAGRTDEDHDGTHRRLSRNASRLRRVSTTESPPNFSSTASARTSATIASATMPAAGTAQTSDR